MTITVRHSPQLQLHLETFEVDGATVASVLFNGGRLSYPGRKEMEVMLGYTEPYTLSHEARVIEGLPRKVVVAIRMLAGRVPLVRKVDETLDLLWTAHEDWIVNGISPDRLVAALVMTQLLAYENDLYPLEGMLREELTVHAYELVKGMHMVGFPPSHESLEELFDGAPPACVGLGLVDIDWKGRS